MESYVATVQRKFKLCKLFYLYAVGLLQYTSTDNKVITITNEILILC